jgi:hypothetical protein
MKEVVTREERRYQRKGPVSLVIGGLMVAGFFYLTPIFQRAVWPSIMEFQQRIGMNFWLFSSILFTLLHLIVLIIGNLVMWIIYRI